MTFRDRPFAARRGQLGDQAEGKFEELHSEPFVRYGIRRPDEQGIRVQDLPHRLRHTPDYVTPSGLVEVLGCGRDGQVKLGLTKWNCLLFWGGVAPVYLWIWSSTKKKFAFVPLEVVAKLLDQGQVALGSFVEQKAYLAIPFDALREASS